MPRDKLIQFRKGTAAAWTSANPTLEAGEAGFETDTGKLKIGDGSTAWASLSYLSSSGSTPALNDVTDVTITSVADNEVLAYDNASGEWINQTAAEAGLASASHTHAASDVTSGTFANARISQSSVTQHQAALSITESQISDLGAYITASSTDTLTNKSGSNSQWTNDEGYITGLGSFTTTDLAEGTNLYFTDERAQDAVGTIFTDSAEIDFTYTDATPSITASIVAGSVDETKLDTSVNASLDLADSALQSGDNISVLTNDSGYITASSTNTLTNKSGSNSQWTNDEGYASQLSELSDVDATVASPSDGDILVYRSAGADWVLEAKPAGGGGEGVKAHGYVQGTGTVSLLDGSNISSIDDDGTGNYGVNLSVTMSGTNFTAGATVANVTSNRTVYVDSRTTTSVEITTTQSVTTSAIDADFGVWVFGDLA